MPSCFESDAVVEAIGGEGGKGVPLSLNLADIGVVVVVGTEVSTGEGFFSPDPFSLPFSGSIVFNAKVKDWVALFSLRFSDSDAFLKRKLDVRLVSF